MQLDYRLDPVPGASEVVGLLSSLNSRVESGRRFEAFVSVMTSLIPRVKKKKASEATKRPAGSHPSTARNVEARNGRRPKRVAHTMTDRLALERSE